MVGFGFGATFVELAEKSQRFGKEGTGFFAVFIFSSVRAQEVLNDELVGGLLVADEFEQVKEIGIAGVEVFG